LQGFHQFLTHLLCKNRNDPNFRPKITAVGNEPWRMKYIACMQECWQHDAAKRPTFEHVLDVLQEVKQEIQNNM